MKNQEESNDQDLSSDSDYDMCEEQSGTVCGERIEEERHSLKDDFDEHGEDMQQISEEENSDEVAGECEVSIEDCEDDDEDVVESDEENDGDNDDGDNEEYDEDMEILGRRIVEMNLFFDELRRVSRHNKGNCSFSEMRVVREIRVGFHSKFVVKCGDCRRRFKIHANQNERTAETLDINSATVIGASLIGIGYSQLEQFSSVIDVPAMCADKFKDLNDKMGKFWEETAIESMREAAEEEARLAIERGDVDPVDGIPFITVVTDATWSKRSYNKNFTALSGVGAVVGAITGKVLWLGVRNRYCVRCVRAKNQGTTPRSHPCTRNFKGPSSEMEWDTILEGFKSSVELYNLRYLKLIADGDSSTYAKLLEHRPYPDHHIEKIECTNHLFRNFRKGIEAAVKGCPRGLNKHVVDNLERIRKDIHSAIQYRKRGNTSPDETISLLKSDLSNILRHVFGDHSNCPSYIKSFCKDDRNYIPALEQCNTYEKMSTVMRKLMYCAKDLIKGETNNPAEHFNSIVAKFVGGKRVNFSLSDSYGYKAKIAAVQFNTKTALSSFYKTKFNKDAPLLARKIEQKRLRQAEQGKERRRIMKQNKIIRTPFCRVKDLGSGYGPNAQTADMSAEDFENEKTIHLEKMENHQANKILIEEQTRNKQQSNVWNEIVPKILLSRDFGNICKAKSLSLWVKEKTQRHFFETKSTKHQKESQPVALQQLGAEQNLNVRAIGLVIDKEHNYLAASPTGTVSDNDMVIEIQCPLAITNMDPNDPNVLGE